MRFSVGYQPCVGWVDSIIESARSVHDVYFSFGSTPSGRQAVSDESRQLEDLGRLADAGLCLGLLFNANCYGGEALSKAFYSHVGTTVERFSSDGSLRSVTTTSPLVAKFVKDNFPDLETRASVNMEIGTVEGLEYLSDVFDGYYLKRELNRDLAAVGRIKAWCDGHGKRLYILANSGCLNHCSSHVFHDNLVAHEQEIVRKDNGYGYRGACWKWLADPANRAKWLERTNWIAPEDVGRYEGLCTAMKLATRINANPSRVLLSYATGSHLGDIKDLLEPNHSALWKKGSCKTPLWCGETPHPRRGGVLASPDEKGFATASRK